MKLTVPVCRKCKDLATEILEVLEISNPLDRSDNGEFDYMGEGDIDWNSQTPKLDHSGRATVSCDNGHQWKTEVKDTR